MTKTSTAFNIARITPAVAGMAVLFSLPATAITLDASSGATADGFVGTPSVFDNGNFKSSHTSAPDGGEGGIGIDGAGGSFGGSYANGDAFISSNGVMGSGGNGFGGMYAANGLVSWSDSITNNTGVAQNVSFDFHIWHGFIVADIGMGAADYASGEVFLDIRVNGLSLVNSFAKVEVASGVANILTTSGNLDLMGSFFDVFADFADYSWGDQFFTLSLGVLGAGETIDIDYSMGGMAAGHGDINTGGYGGYGGEYGGNCGYYYGACGVSSTAWIGDPFGVTFDPNAPNQNQVNVPEPVGVSLGLAGLLLLGLRRCRKMFS